jgi:hypothetical protein
MQVALGLMWCNKEVNNVSTEPKQDMSINFWGKMAVFLCFTAEFFCNHATITLDYKYNVCETVLWTIALGALIPGVIKLNRRASRINGTPIAEKEPAIERQLSQRASSKRPRAQSAPSEKTIDSTAVILFTYMIALTCILFVGQLCLDHIPLQYRLWREDVASGATFKPFFIGLESSINERVVS